MEKYPKLWAVGIMDRGKDHPVERVYLIEDEYMYYGFVRGVKGKRDILQLRPADKQMGALRACQVAFPPKEDDNADEIYKEILDAIEKDGRLPRIEWMRTYGTPKDNNNYCIRISDPNNLVTDIEKEMFEYY